MDFVEFLAQSEHKITLWTDKPPSQPPRGPALAAKAARKLQEQPHVDPQGEGQGADLDPDKEAGPRLQRFCPLVSRHGGHVLQGEELAARALCCLHRRGPVGGQWWGGAAKSQWGAPFIYKSPPRAVDRPNQHY